MPEAAYAIEAKGIEKSFGTLKALDQVDLKVRQGSILSLLGPNGAGKTTLVRVLTTLLRPDSGSVKVGSFDVMKEPHKVRKIIGLAGQSAAVDKNLTGRENLELVGQLYHMGSRLARERASELLEKFGLAEAGDRSSKTYSGGMQRRLDLAASLVGNPEILFLDEPTTGLDPRSRLDLWHTIESLAQSGVTVLLTTQYLEEADHLADEIAVIDQGKIIALGSPEELKNKVGGDMVELHLADVSRTGEAARAIIRLGNGETLTDEDSGQVVLPVNRGPSVLAEVVREMDAHSLEIADINYRRPSLDEVFLTLTGKRTTGTDDEAAAKAGRNHAR